MAKGLLRQKFWEKTKALVKPKGLLRKKFAEKKAAASALSVVPPLPKSDTPSNQILRKVNSETEIALKTDIPEIPVKSVKQNGVALTPDSNGAVNVKGVYYATCDTSVFSRDKVATLKNINETFVLEEGVVVYVRFANASGSNSSSASISVATLNVANTGAKSIYSGNQASRIGSGDAYAWHKGSIVGFIYDGTYWRMLRPSVASTANEAGSVRLYDNIDTSSGIAASTQLTNKVATDIAPAWTKNTSVSYSAGDYVIYTDGKLYKAKVDIPANTAWSASNWQAVTVEGETKSDKTNLKTILAGMPDNLDTYDNALQAINVLWNAVYKLAYGKDRSN